MCAGPNRVKVEPSGENHFHVEAEKPSCIAASLIDTHMSSQFLVLRQNN